MNRRRFITLLGGGAAWPFAAGAQQAGVLVIGLLSATSAGADAHRLTALRQGLRQTGHIDGQNVALEYRAAAGQYGRLPALAADLIRNHVSVIITMGGVPAARAAKAATATIPIVFYVGGDPVDFGLIDSLNRPGGNLTGVSSLNTELGPKWLELLHEVVPSQVAMAVLLNPSNPLAEPLTGELQAAARKIGVDLSVLHAGTEGEIDSAFAALAHVGAKAAVIGNDPVFNGQAEQIARLAFHHRVPTVYQYREFAVAGGLISYGGSIADVFYQMGVYAGRVLKGEKPADLPVLGAELGPAPGKLDYAVAFAPLDLSDDAPGDRQGVEGASHRVHVIIRPARLGPSSLQPAPFIN
jgi:putative ABC transport system substrate-binding protein